MDDTTLLVATVEAMQRELVKLAGDFQSVNLLVHPGKCVTASIKRGHLKGPHASHGILVSVALVHATVFALRMLLVFGVGRSGYWCVLAALGPRGWVWDSRRGQFSGFWTDGATRRLRTARGAAFPLLQCDSPRQVRLDSLGISGCWCFLFGSCPFSSFWRDWNHDARGWGCFGIPTRGPIV